MNRFFFVFLCLSLAALFSDKALAQDGPPTTPEIVNAAAAAKTPTSDGPFQPTWESIKQNYTAPQWFIDAKFGITMHWGLYSVAAYHNEWYEKYMYGVFADWHAQNFGPQDKFGYKDFIPLFTADKFNADDWATLCKDAGAKYVMPTCEHHDGFSMWDSDINRWNAAKMGPKRDIIGELAVAVRKQGMKFGVCNHSIEHYTFINPKAGVKPTLKTDLDDPATQDFYWTIHNDATLQKFLEDWVGKNMELIDKYQVDVLWFDNGVNRREYDPLKLKVAAYYYNQARKWGKEVTIDTKDSAYLAGSVLDFEKPGRGPKDFILPGVWEVEDTLGTTWGYTKVEKFRGSQAIVNELCEIVSKGGNLLLNLSPTGDGTITDDQRNALLGVGEWLKLNGDAIYGTHSWTQYADGEFRFTVKGDTLYALNPKWPSGGSVVIPALATSKVPDKVTAVGLLGGSDSLKFTQDEQGLKVELPATQPGKFQFALKISGLKMNPPGPPVPAVMRGGRPGPTPTE